MPESSKNTRTIDFHVTRYNPELDREPYMQTYTIPVRAGMTVLDGLHYIKENLDASLAWRYSCRMGVCGSCGMLLNGRPTLACNTQILHIATTDLTVGPLPNFEIIRDLVPDLLTMFEKHRSLMPHIVRADEAEINDPQGEFYQSPAELERYLQFSYNLPREPKMAELVEHDLANRLGALPCNVGCSGRASYSIPASRLCKNFEENYPLLAHF